MITTQVVSKKEKIEKIYTLDEYLKREAKSVNKYELYDEQILKMPNTKFYSNLAASNTLHAIGEAVKLLSKNHLIVGKNQKIFIESENAVVYSDGLVVSEMPIFYKDQEYLLTNPLLVVEVLSRSTQTYDKQGKFDLYTNLPSFHEYVMVDPKRYFVETRFREEEDLWRIKTEKDPTKSVLLRSMGISISLEDIYENVVFPTSKRAP